MEVLIKQVSFAVVSVSGGRIKIHHQRNVVRLGNGFQILKYFVAISWGVAVNKMTYEVLSCKAYLVLECVFYRVNSV